MQVDINLDEDGLAVTVSHDNTDHTYNPLIMDDLAKQALALVRQLQTEDTDPPDIVDGQANRCHPD